MELYALVSTDGEFHSKEDVEGVADSLEKAKQMAREFEQHWKEIAECPCEEYKICYIVKLKLNELDLEHNVPFEEKYIFLD